MEVLISESFFCTQVIHKISEICPVQEEVAVHDIVKIEKSNILNFFENKAPDEGFLGHRCHE